MNPSTKSLLKVFLIALSLVVFASLVGAGIGHADGPSKKDYENLNAIKANQKILSKDRDAYNAFLKAKADNEDRADAIMKDGWKVDWSTMTLIPNVSQLTYDPIKVAKAISCSETSCGTDGTAIHRNNCCGLMKFWYDSKGIRHRAPLYFPTYQASLKAAATDWDTYYGELPTMADAVRWTGNDHPQDWYKTFYTAYNALQ